MINTNKYTCLFIKIKFEEVKDFEFKKTKSKGFSMFNDISKLTFFE